MSIKSSEICLGDKFNRLTFIKNVGHKNGIGLFKCLCGTEKVIKIYLVISGHSRSCGCLRSENCKKLSKKITVGKKFNNLTMVKYTGNIIKGKKICLFKCDCGKFVEIISSSAVSGNTKSCGCRKIASTIRTMTTHGNTKNRNKTSEYSAWEGMRRRCLIKNRKDYRHYGGRGIKICKRWDKFENFIKDMGPRPTGTSLDRIDNNGNYEPSNCRWATKIEQMSNTRKTIKIYFGNDFKSLDLPVPVLG